MKYLAMSILAIRAIGCLVRGKNPLSTLCVLLVSNFPGILPANFALFCIIWQPRRLVALFAEIFYLNGI